MREIGVLGEHTNFVHVIWNSSLELPHNFGENFKETMDNCFAPLALWCQDLLIPPDDGPNNWGICAIESRLTVVDTIIRIQIGIARQLGDFRHFQPVMTCYVGQDNALIHVNAGIIEGLTVPPGFVGEVGRQACCKRIFQDFTDVVWNALEAETGQSTAMITGTHHCRLNCGNCCDGTSRTTSFLGGGLYCPYLLAVGQYCLFYLADVPLEEKNQICQEYFCGDVYQQSSADNFTRELCGTSIGSFVPEYSRVMREEFFQVLDAVLSAGVCPQEAVEKTAKWDEIQQYYRVTGQFLRVVYSEAIPADVRGRVIDCLRWNQIPEIWHLLDESKLAGKTSSSELERSMGALSQWWAMFQGRKAKEAERAVAFSD